MKKVLSLLLAVVLVCSMATVAFAGDLTNTFTCEVCGGTTNDANAYNTHVLEAKCGKCAYCEVGFSASDLSAHQYICPKANIVCDYCGKTYASESDFDSHIEACKAKYFNIPLAKIIAAVKDLIAKIDFGAIIGTVKDKVVPAITDLVGKIDLGSIKLPA